MDKNFLVHLFHILIVGTLFLYVGIRQTNIPNFMYSVLIGFGMLVLLYHGFKIYKKLQEGSNPWINYIHVFIVAPLLLYIGLNKKKTPRFYFEILMMLGFAAIGYHGYYLVNK